MSVKTFTLNGELVSAGEDETILDVCDEQKVPLPRLCHLEGLGDIGACRLCLVEIEGSNKLSPACLTRAEEGREDHPSPLQAAGLAYSRFRGLIAQSQSQAIARARQMACILAGPTVPTKRASSLCLTVKTLQRLTQDVAFKPSSTLTSTSVGAPRRVDVTAATVTV